MYRTFWESYRFFKNLKFQKKFWKKSIFKYFLQAVDEAGRANCIIWIKFTLKMDVNYFSNFFLSISPLSGIPLLCFQKIKKMASKSAFQLKPLGYKFTMSGSGSKFYQNLFVSWKILRKSVNQTALIYPLCWHIKDILHIMVTVKLIVD